MLLIPWLLDGDDVFGRHSKKIEASRRYEALQEGLRALTALMVLREHVIRPLLAASTRPKTDSKLLNPTRIDQHYENLRVGMHQLFTASGWQLNDRQFIFHPFG